LLFYVAVKLYKQFRNDEKKQKEHKKSANRRHAFSMIIIADISMSLDNILAVASAA
jgi:predicted tellurium resistance membrane protein TerC